MKWRSFIIVGVTWLLKIFSIFLCALLKYLVGLRSVSITLSSSFLNRHVDLTLPCKAVCAGRFVFSEIIFSLNIW